MAEAPADLADLADFLAQTPPFSDLDDAARAALLRQLTISYVRKGTSIICRGEHNHELYILRSGAVDLLDENDELTETLEAGECFGFPSLLTGGPAAFDVTARADSLLLHLPEDAFLRLRHEQRDIEQYFLRAHAERIRRALARAPRFSAITTQLRQLVARAPVVAAPDTPVRSAAALMRERRVSSLLIVEGERLVGILTDRDLRNRVLAVDGDGWQPVRNVMSRDPFGLPPNAYAFDALLEMIRRGVHHLPVVVDDWPLGLVTLNDLMSVHAEHPVYLIEKIMRLPDVDALTELAPLGEKLFLQLVEADARYDQIGRLMTMVTDAFTRRLLQLGEARLGTPPCDYAWLALGSQARREQTVKTDQDNALVLAEPGHDDYFAALATFVSDGLAAAGYVYCTGKVMATNPQWRQPLSVWQEYFRRWIAEPEAKALMHASIFFDLRIVHGNTELVDALKRDIALRAKANGIFLATLARNALQHEPPVGFFGQFVLQDGGEGRALDLKHRGSVPVIDIARLHALASGEFRVNTQGRLRAAAEGGVLNRDDARSLLEAFELIGHVRVRHQAEQLAAGRSPDNFVQPAALSSFARRHLKDAFQIVRNAQAALRNRYPGI